MPKGKKNSFGSPQHIRSKYVDHSQQFMHWIDRLELEKTWMGRLALRFEGRFRLRRLGFLFLFCLGLSYLLFYDFEFPYHFRVGQVAETDFRSPVSFEIVDEIATEDKRVAAEQAIPPVFDFDPDVYDKTVNNVFRAFRAIRQHLLGSKWANVPAQHHKQIQSFRSHKEDFDKAIGIEVSNTIFEWLTELRFNAQIENVIAEVLLDWSEYKVADSLDRLLTPQDKTVLIRMLEKNRNGQEFIIAREKIVDLALHQPLDFAQIEGSQQLSQLDRVFVQDLVKTLLQPNMTFNRQETLERRQKARESVLPVVIVVKKNQMLISQGTVVQPIHITLLKQIQNLKSSQRTDFLALVAAIMLVALVIVFLSYFQRFARRVRLEGKDMVVMAMVTLLVVLVTKLFWFTTSAAFASRFGWLIPESFFLYAAPVTLGAMLVGLLVTSGEMVWLYTVFIAVALGLMVEGKFSFVLITMVGGIAAARGVYGYKRRNDIYFAGLRTGLVNALMIAVVFLMDQSRLATSTENLMWLMAAGLLSGVMASGLAMMIVPLLESVFNYTTNVKLLELSNLNHPLMSEMIVKAPGTYHHSLVVGHMCEAAAEAIGANPLLAKVMAYYHDIGKMSHAAYFIENQKSGANPHDHLSPHMSKTILIAHVKDGAELGIKHKLGKPIIDGILQHHGTTLISYFYNKALEEQDEAIDHVSEEDFRYPGPKPQFKEAGLCMLADSIEAAARSLDEPTTARLQNIVRNIIQRKFMEGQLDECDLTLKDLSVVESAFERILLGIYHQRIDYPKAAGGGAAEPARLTFAGANPGGKSKKDTA